MNNFTWRGQIMAYSADLEPKVQKIAKKVLGIVKRRHLKSPRFFVVPLLTMLILLLFNACASVITNHGYLPSIWELSFIEIGIDTHDSVEKKIGRPPIHSLLTEDGWFYVHTKMVQNGPKAPKEVDREVLVISFNSDGFVENIQKFGQEQGEVVVLSSRVTQSDIKGITFMRQLMGNAGRFSAGDLLNQ
jgi:outer membrane protein assembly factor BamE (lipoprotein component of BamABCDE complex)